MKQTISDLTAALARNAEAVCQHYLPDGRREGRYWMVGDVQGAPGRSMYVRLTGPDSGKGRAGKWVDAATNEHGDLLDIIRESCGLVDFAEAAREARRFLSLPQPDASSEPKPRLSSVPVGSPGAARRLFAMAQPIKGTLAETYLRSRGITALHDTGSLHFHPHCYYRSGRDGPTEAHPAMIAAVTDQTGNLTGVQRTWLDPSGARKAHIATPRRAIGNLLGHAVRFGFVDDTLGVGEGIETTLAIREALPGLPVAAALSAVHLATVRFPPALRRLYILRDNDPAGEAAVRTLTDRAHSAGIDAIVLMPQLGDFNDDLLALGVEGLRTHLRFQLAAEDVARLLQVRPEHAGME